LTYGIWSRFVGRRQRGPFAVGTFTRVPELGRLVSLTLAELARIREQPPTAQELAAAKSLLAGRFALGLETSAAVVSALVDLDVHALPADSLDTYRGRIRALTEEQVAAAARDFVRPDEAAIVVVGPADAVVPQLEPFGEVRIVQP
jgi:predicted Zn-dependent peptidase